jgi:hypothetical protein
MMVAMNKAAKPAHSAILARIGPTGIPPKNGCNRLQTDVAADYMRELYRVDVPR